MLHWGQTQEEATLHKIADGNAVQAVTDLWLVSIPPPSSLLPGSPARDTESTESRKDSPRNLAERDKSVDGCFWVFHAPTIPWLMWSGHPSINLNLENCLYTSLDSSISQKDRVIKTPKFVHSILTLSQISDSHIWWPTDLHLDLLLGPPI